MIVMGRTRMFEFDRAPPEDDAPDGYLVAMSPEDWKILAALTDDGRKTLEQAHLRQRVIGFLTRLGAEVGCTVTEAAGRVIR